MSKKVHKLTIDRKMWICGDETMSALRIGENYPGRRKMCCLGFYLKSAGVPASILTNKYTPANIAEHVPESCQWLLHGEEEDSYDSPACTNLIDANDDRYLTSEERESKIKKLFAKHNVQVQFVN